MGVGGAHEVAMHHVRQLDVVDIIALALREADILNALAFAAHAFQAGLAGLTGDDHLVHSAASWKLRPLSLAAAYWIALTMFW
jgi:hypothetical protein